MAFKSHVKNKNMKNETKGKTRLCKKCPRMESG